MMNQGKKYLAIDVGASSIKYGVVHGDTSITNKNSIPTPHDSMESLLDAYCKIYKECGDGTSGVGISFTATLDATDSYCFAGSLGQYTNGKKILPIFQEVFPVPVSVENDGNCAALAESAYGSLKDCNDGIMLVLGTAIGGGIIKDKKVHHGKKSCAGEFSYVVTNYETQGRWDERNGTIGLTKPLGEMKNEPNMNGKRFFEYINNNDPDAICVLDEFTKHLAVQIFNLQLVYAPDKFVIGGGISTQPALMSSLHKNINSLYEQFDGDLPRAEVVLSTYMNDANLIGAVCHLKACYSEI